MSGFRKTAQLIFENIDGFGSGHYLDWGETRSKLIELAAAPQLSTFISSSEIAELRQVSDWGFFYSALAKHRLFSAPVSGDAIVRLWHKIRGFDIDTLLDLGDPDGLRTRRDDEVTARYALGRRVADAAHKDGRSPPQDEHVHLGQIVDLGLLWHSHLRAEGCRWAQYAPRIDQGRRFRGGQHDQADRRKIPLAAHRWGVSMARARLLFSYASVERRDVDSEAISARDFLHDVLECDEGEMGTGGKGLAALEQTWNALLIKGSDFSLRENIIKERDLVASLVDGTARPLVRAYAAAYVTLKSAAMHKVCSNAVDGPVNDRFDRFTKSLGVLDHIYGLRRSAFDQDDEFVTVSRAHLKLGSRLLPRALLRASRESMGLGQPDGLRPFANRLKTARRLFDSDNAKLVLSFQRTDFINDADAFSHISTAIIEKRAGWEQDLSCTIVGLDLCGPEALDIVTLGSRHGDRGPTGMILDPIDRIFELRERLAIGGSGQIYVSFHAGEHVVDWELGFLATLSILTDPRFDASIDRLSHALILCIPPPEWPVASEKTKSARGAARDRVRQNCKEPHGRLFTEAERSQIVDALDTRNSNALHPICDAVRGKVIAGEITVEICPYSNFMIRNIRPEYHPWREAIHSGRVVIGTDDPSLTQTLPWVEHAALAFGRQDTE